MERFSQTVEVYRYIQENGSITPMEALHELGCYRLGARIHELRKQGVPILTELVQVERRPRWWRRLKGHKPESVRYARYTISHDGKSEPAGQ